MTPAEPRERFNAIIAEVRLGTDLVERYPHGLSATATRQHCAPSPRMRVSSSSTS
jgi:hypothetical protein